MMNNRDLRRLNHIVRISSDHSLNEGLIQTVNNLNV